MLAVAFVVPTADAQSPAPPTVSTFTLAPQAIALPGGHNTFVGTDLGMKLGVLQHAELRDDNIVSADTSMQSFLLGADYHFSGLSRIINNASPQLNGYALEFYGGASAGLDRVTLNGATNVHYAASARVGLNYIPGGGTVAINLFEVAYMRLPGFNNNAVSVAGGIKFSWGQQ